MKAAFGLPIILFNYFTSVLSHTLEIPLKRVEVLSTPQLYDSPGNTTPLTFYEQNFLFYADAEVGTPGQKFRFVLDTGSSDVWIPAQQCTDQVCGNHTRFNMNQSDTFVPLNKTFGIAYGSGSVKGTWGRDTVTIGEQNVKRVDIGLVTQETTSLKTIITDGIIGLGLPEIASAPNNQTWFSLLTQQNKDLDPYFTFSLDLDPSKPSLFTVGSLQEKYTQNRHINYHSVVEPVGYWTLAMNGLRVSNWYSAEEDYCNPYCPVIVDTGTSLITVPDNFYLTLMLQILRNTDSCTFNSRQGLFVCSDNFDCQSLPEITLFIPDQTNQSRSYQISPNQYVAANGNNGCAILLSQSPPGAPIWILGMSFLQRYYTIFDQGSKRVAMIDKIETDPSDRPMVGDVSRLMLVLFLIIIGVLGTYYLYKYYQARLEINRQNRVLTVDPMYNEL